ncbi:hypothetical protein [Brevundimonas sp. TSRC1-1]|uniref:hypothetical protein n=1 Tax=Brevundimonas sp. TSRC1-1 TaxID=2804562 RepID=UPI003CF611B7
MINIPPIIERITELLNQDTDASVTYAALEARLALEKVCYDRLRQCHDYISHEDLKKWQPNQVVNTLINDVDQHATSTRTLSISRLPSVEGRDPKDEDYVEIGTEVGFDPKLMGKFWNALAKLALHVRLPQSRNDVIPNYGDKEKIKAKVIDVITELRRLSNTTMTFSGIGEEVSFECDCGTKNRRRADLLKEGQVVSCINPECAGSWHVRIDGKDIGFKARLAHIKCEQCAKCNHIPWRSVAAMKYDQVGSFYCDSCEYKNYFKWVLKQVRPEIVLD